VKDLGLKIIYFILGSHKIHLRTTPNSFKEDPSFL
jgi:hypothetical protein